MMASVDELQGSTAKINSHLDRLQSVEKDIVALKSSVPAKEDVGKVRAEMKKVYVSVRGRGVELELELGSVDSKGRRSRAGAGRRSREELREEAGRGQKRRGGHDGDNARRRSCQSDERRRTWR